jgi:hypothetical protein
VMLLLFQPFTNGTVIIFGVWTPTTDGYNVNAGTIKYYDMAGVEVANATDLSTYSSLFEAIGR